jgi:hypothetical protein
VLLVGAGTSIPSDIPAGHNCLTSSEIPSFRSWLGVLGANDHRAVGVSKISSSSSSDACVAGLNHMLGVRKLSQAEAAKIVDVRPPAI